MVAPRRPEHEVQQEEANAFAAFLLMPHPHFQKAVMGIDWLDDVAVGKVAKRFQVTLGAVHYRQSLDKLLRR